MVIEGINQTYYEEDSLPFLELMEELLNFKDNMMPSKLEWLIGYPVAQVTSNEDKMDHFGTYGSNNLDEAYLSFFPPSLNLRGAAHPAMELILTNRRQNEELSMSILHAILKVAKGNESVFEYLSNLPPPTYVSANIFDWVPKFMAYFEKEMNKYVYKLDSRTILLNNTR